MALSMSKGSGKAAAKPVAAAVTSKAAAKTTAAKPEATAPAQQQAHKTGGWYTRGNATAQAIAQEDKRIEQKYGSMWRFFLDKGETASITFVDGFMTDQGILDSFMYRQHTINVHGKWQNFVCTSEQEPCPLCEIGDEASLVGVFTVIDHRVFKGQKGVYKDRAKLFIAKRQTLKQLQTLASKRNGLSGWTVDVSRIGEKAANVGDVFDFQQHRKEAELRKLFVQTDVKTKKTDTVYKVADYVKEIVYMTAAELRKLGFGKGSPIGAESGPKEDTSPATSDVAKELG